MSDTPRVNIQVRAFPAELWRRFRAHAVSSGVSVRQALIEALSQYLEGA